jgi:hypothetical protein
VRPGKPLLDLPEGPDQDRLAGGQDRLCVPVVLQPSGVPSGTSCAALNLPLLRSGICPPVIRRQVPVSPTPVGAV